MHAHEADDDVMYWFGQRNADNLANASHGLRRARFCIDIIIAPDSLANISGGSDVQLPSFYDVLDLVRRACDVENC